MANDLAAAKALDELMLALMAQDVEIPAHVAEDLKAGRALAGMGARKPEDAELAAKAATVLEGVEMNLLAQAELAFGTEQSDAWQEKINAARELPPDAAAVYVNRMVKGVPRGEPWLRVRTSELEDTGTDPTAFGLAAAAQEDGYTLIYGKQESIDGFLKHIRKQLEKLGKVGFKRDS